jgi:hypothetical protein
VHLLLLWPFSATSMLQQSPGGTYCLSKKL